MHGSDSGHCCSLRWLCFQLTLKKRTQGSEGHESIETKTQPIPGAPVHNTSIGLASAEQTLPATASYCTHGKSLTAVLAAETQRPSAIKASQPGP